MRRGAAAACILGGNCAGRLNLNWFNESRNLCEGWNFFFVNRENDYYIFIAIAAFIVMKMIKRN